MRGEEPYGVVVEFGDLLAPDESEIDGASLQGVGVETASVVLDDDHKLVGLRLDADPHATHDGLAPGSPLVLALDAVVDGVANQMDESHGDAAEGRTT